MIDTVALLSLMVALETKSKQHRKWANKCSNHRRVVYLTYLTQEGSHAPIPSTGVCHTPCFSLVGTVRTAGELGKNAAFTKSAYSDVTSCIISWWKKKQVSKKLATFDSVKETHSLHLLVFII